MRRSVLPFIFILVLSISHIAFCDEVEEDEYEYADEEIEERAFLIVQKKIVETEIPDGSNVTVLLIFHNAGTRTATDIEIKDKGLSKSVSTGESFDSIKLNQLSPGLSENYKITLRPTSPGKLTLSPARVIYTPIQGSNERQTVWSTSAAVLVLTTNEYLVSKVLLMGSYVTFGVLKTQVEWIRFGVVAGVMFLAVTMNYLAKKLSVARQDRMRQKALDAIEKGK
eukprot:g5270.t1